METVSYSRVGGWESKNGKLINSRPPGRGSWLIQRELGCREFACKRLAETEHVLLFSAATVPSARAGGTDLLVRVRRTD